MSDVQPLLEVEHDIMLHASHINVAPAFAVLLIATLIVAVMLWRVKLLRSTNIKILAAGLITSIIGCTGYDTFLLKLYRGGYEINLNTVSGVCMLISVSSFSILAYQLYLINEMKKEKQSAVSRY